MKLRLSQLDVGCLVNDLRTTVVGLRLENIYDLASSSKTFIFKFAKPDKKEHVILETGIRIHPTNYNREKNKFPNTFTLKLRKILSTKRCTSVSQLGIDRVIDITFYNNQLEGDFHLLLEFYAKGNIVLTDANYVILALQRVHKKEEDVIFSPGNVYPIMKRKTFEPMTLDKIDEILKVTLEKLSSAPKQQTQTKKGQNLEEEEIEEEKIEENEESESEESDEDGKPSKQQRKQKKLKKDQKAKEEKEKEEEEELAEPAPKKEREEEIVDSNTQLRKCFVSDPKFDFYGSAFIDHLFLKSGIPLTFTVGDLLQKSENLNQFAAKLFNSFEKEADAFFIKCNDTAHPGFILLKSPYAANDSAIQKEEEINLIDYALLEPEKQEEIKANFVEFSPIFFEQYKEKSKNLPMVVKFKTFSECVDAYFSFFDTKKLETQKDSIEHKINKKLEKIKTEQESHATELKEKENINNLKAQLILHYQMLVDEAIGFVASAVSESIPWEEITRVVSQQRKEKSTDPAENICAIISRVNLPQNQIVLDLEVPDSILEQYESIYGKNDSKKGKKKNKKKQIEEEGDADNPFSSENQENFEKKKQNPIAQVEVLITDTAYTNAQSFFGQKKKASKKLQQTIDASAKALKKAEQKSEKKLAEKQKEILSTVNIQIRRKRFWFEKFYWFITSDRFLVIAGRDEQQNELLVKKYLQPNDIYLHADVHGAASVIIKAKPGMSIIPKKVKKQKIPSENPNDDAISTNSSVASTTTVDNTQNPDNYVCPFPESTIFEAGCFTIARSSAWKEKIFSEKAYWVFAHQVSKSAPTGSYLTTGSFMIYGRKNFIPSGQMLMGMGVLFKTQDQNNTDFENEEEAEDEEEEEEDEEEEIESEESPISNQESSSSTLNEKIEEIKEEETIELKIEPKEEEDEEDDDKTPISPISISDNPQLQQQYKNLNLKDKKKLKKFKKQGLDETKALEKIIFEKEHPEDAQAQSKDDEKSESNNEDDNLTSEKPNSNKNKKMSLKKKKKLKKREEGFDSEDEKLKAEFLGPKKIKKKDLKKQKKLGIAKANAANALPKQETYANTVIIKKFSDEEAVQTISEIEFLTDAPDPEKSVISFAIPVVAPYVTLMKYKYRVKIAPGNLQRGKGGKIALGYLIQDSKNKFFDNSKKDKKLQSEDSSIELLGSNENDAIEKEVTFIKKITDNELVATMPADVKIVPPVGVVAVEEDNKKKGNNKKKAK